MSVPDQQHYLMELYQGEVFGEALFSRMLLCLDDARQRYVVATMLQFETETKARLRQAGARHGLDLAEDPAQRVAGERAAATLDSMSWQEKMRWLQTGIGEHYLPRYRQIAAVAVPEDAEITSYMVAHEAALFDVANRELTGQALASAEAIVTQLHFPLPSLSMDPCL